MGKSAPKNGVEEQGISDDAEVSKANTAAEDISDVLGDANQGECGDGVMEIDENQFTCGTCGKHYTFKRNLTRHQQKECGKEATHFCDMCGKSFKHSFSLKSHVKKLH